MYGDKRCGGLHRLNVQSSAASDGRKLSAAVEMPAGDVRGISDGWLWKNPDEQREECFQVRPLELRGEFQDEHFRGRLDEFPDDLLPACEFRGEREPERRRKDRAGKYSKAFWVKKFSDGEPVAPEDEPRDAPAKSEKRAREFRSERWNGSVCFGFSASNSFCLRIWRATSPREVSFAGEVPLAGEFASRAAGEFCASTGEQLFFCAHSFRLASTCARSSGVRMFGCFKSSSV